MTREEVAKAYNLLTDEEQEKLLYKIEVSCNTEDIIVQYLNSTVLIYDTINDYFLSWYKLTHIGRSLNTNITDVDTVYYLFQEIIES